MFGWATSVGQTLAISQGSFEDSRAVPHTASAAFGRVRQEAMSRVRSPHVVDLG